MHKFCITILLALLLIPQLALGQPSPNTSRPFAPGKCGPADSSYIRVAEETGGIPMFLQRSEVAQSAKFMMANSGENHVTLLWTKGSLHNDSREFIVPVDSTVENLSFTLSANNHDARMEVFGPANVSLVSDPHANVTDFTCGRLVTVSRPAAGNYRISLTGAGDFWLTATGRSDIYLHNVHFVELGGRPGHEGMFPIHGQPLLIKPANLEMSVSGSVRLLSFSLVTPDNRPLKTFELKLVEHDQDDQEFSGTLALPDGAFRIVATGTDLSGNRFQRFHEGLIRPASIAVDIVKQQELKPGQTSTFIFKVTNYGNTNSFRLVGICANGWPSHLDRSQLALKTGEAGTIGMIVSVPPDVAKFASTDLVVTATAESDPYLTNSYVLHLSVEPDYH